MQDRYAGDIGDFAKFAVLRGLLHDTQLRLGLVWFLTAQATDPAGDGRHIRYLERSQSNDSLYRVGDRELFDALGELVSSGVRKVAAYPALNILPSDTIYYEDLLTFDERSTPAARVSHRDAWLQQAVSETASCHVVMFDPDNGLEVVSTKRHSIRGPKYVFFDELMPYVDRNQTIIVYQHANRSGTFEEQVSKRLVQLRTQMEPAAEPFAIIWRTISTRAFLVIPAESHAAELRARAKSLLAGPLGQHLELYE